MLQSIKTFLPAGKWSKSSGPDARKCCKSTQYTVKLSCHRISIFYNQPFKTSFWKVNEISKFTFFWKQMYSEALADKYVHSHMMMSSSSNIEPGRKIMMKYRVTNGVKRSRD